MKAKNTGNGITDNGDGTGTIKCGKRSYKIWHFGEVVEIAPGSKDLKELRKIHRKPTAP